MWLDPLPPGLTYLEKATKFCSKYPKVHLYQKLAQLDPRT